MARPVGVGIIPPEERFEPKFIPEPNSGCWLWIGALAGTGYSSFFDGSKVVPGHKYAYLEKYGAVPQGTELDHKCRTPSCVNPDHLEPVTHQVNVIRGQAGAYQKIKTHCPQGHEYTDENTYRTPKGRHCRECHNKRGRDQRAACRN